MKEFIALAGFLRVGWFAVWVGAVATVRAQTGPGTALSFDGTNDVISVGAPALSPPWTAEFWVKRQPAADNGAILIGDSTNILKLEQISAAGKVGFSRFGVADFTFNYTAPTGTWVHLAFVTDSNTRLYVNGIPAGTNGSILSLPRGQIGSDIPNRSNQHLHGVLDEVRFWSVARSQAQIQSNMHHAVALPDTNLVAYWRFNEGSGLSTFDATGNPANSGQLLNGVAWVASTVPFVPTVTTMAAGSGPTNGAATLYARVNPNGLGTSAWFVWGTISNLVNQTAKMGLGNGSNPVLISAPIGGMLPNTEYFYQAMGTNSGGSTPGAEGAITPFSLLLPPSNVVAVTNNSGSTTDVTNSPGSLPNLAFTSPPNTVIVLGAHSPPYLDGPLTVASNLTIIATNCGASPIDCTGNPFVTDVNGTLTLIGLTISNCASGSGGAIFVGSSKTLIATNCTFIGNRANLDGGAIQALGNLQLYGCTFVSNRATGSGGAIDVRHTSTATSCSLTSCTIVSNTAFAGGGGILVESTLPGGTPWLQLVNCTIARNSAFSGGGIMDNTTGGLRLQNSIVAQNAINIFGAGADVSSSGVGSGGFNLIGRRDGSSGWLSDSGDLTGSAAAPLDPLLARLDDYGGCIQTMELLPGSPAIDTGMSPTVDTDQRRFATRQNILSYSPAAGDYSDIGAFEVQTFDLTTAPALDIVALTPTTMQLSWEVKAKAYTLESTPALLPSAWTPVPVPVPLPMVGDKFVVTVSVPPTFTFFRLRAP